MGNYLDSSMDRRTNPGPLLPLTPYETWQIEKFGNFIPEKSNKDYEKDFQFFNLARILSIEIDGQSR
jgi:hypothetical protein